MLAERRALRHPPRRAIERQSFLKSIGSASRSPETGARRSSARSRNVRELHSHRRSDRLAERDRLTIGDRGQEGDRAAGRNARRGANDPLVELVGEPHGEQGRTLRQHGRVEFRRTLRDDAKRGAVLPSFLGDPSDRQPGRAEGLPVVGGNIAVRFFAQHVDFVSARAPERDLEREPREHRHDRVGDFVGQAGQPDDRDRQPSGRDAKEADITLAMSSSTTSLPNMNR